MDKIIIKILRILLLLFTISNSAESTIPVGILENIYKYYTGSPPLSRGRVHDEQSIAKEYDFIIIGAGSGGSVLANRLTEITEWQVLLIEAGKDEIFLTDIPLLASTMQITAYNWGYKTEPRAKNADGNGGYCLSMTDGRCNWPRGKAVGGTSVINFMMYTRGSRADYDSWEAQGNPGWSYKDVLPYFLKSENSKLEKFDKRYHSTNGYLDVTYSPYVSRLRGPFLDAAKEMGYTVNDYNAEKILGFSVAQANLRHGRRVSASKAFLKPIRNRPNFHISKFSRVMKIVIDPDTKTAVGVEFVKDRRTYFVKATKEVLLSAGTLNSPQLLMLSGIGPREHLESLGIRVLEDLPVGLNLQDHVSMSALTFLVNDSITIVEPRLASNPANTIDYFTKGAGPLTVPGGAEGLAFIDTKRATRHRTRRKNSKFSYFPKFTQDRSFENYFNSNFNSISSSTKFSNFPSPPNATSITVDSSFSKIPKPTGPSIEKDDPDIELVLGLGAMTGDASGSIRGLLGLSDEFYKEVFAAYDGFDAFSIVPILMHPKSRGNVTLKSSNPFHWPVLQANYYDNEEDLRIMVRGIRKAIELASTNSFKRFNSTLLPVKFPGCKDLPFDSDAYWSCVSRHISTTLGHFIGTCKMATRENDGVVDSRLKVHGIKRLRVVDASIMPTIIAGHTNAPTIMIGEKASDMIKEDWRGIT
ncbi:glucose dehydrogenase [FAD, quinone] [Cephus cinctus]|uniref:Glucose dehydrogenase [FAD, quinone] n=1 Tax=Cephus cinctus TaxID=211228 RepID=A0AAJ7C0B9_CEPCN|nr:glucose dehydrogenase [FAD, quinone] [Cephus cinctus]XP_015598847.1 glucose dehydrogenase [FAD, quinone] [Cephus cinctus]